MQPHASRIAFSSAADTFLHAYLCWRLPNHMHLNQFRVPTQNEMDDIYLYIYPKQVYVGRIFNNNIISSYFACIIY